MASLQEIKTRLSSVATTKKITKAMQLVATAKLKKAKDNLQEIQDYYTSVYDVFQKLLNSIDDVDKLFPVNKNKPGLIILVTSDLGLCGSYNSNVIKLAKQNAKPGDKLVVVGNKGVAHFNAIGRSMDLALEHVGDKPQYDLASKLGNKALAEFLTGEISSVKIIHTKFINSVTFEAESTQLIPVEKSEKEVEHLVAEFEPDAGTVLKNAIPLYLSGIIYGALVESKVSEMSSRRTAMENATDNANELIDKLDLEYNRVRQAGITQEISEIVAGSQD